MRMDYALCTSLRGSRRPEPLDRDKQHDFFILPKVHVVHSRFSSSKTSPVFDAPTHGILTFWFFGRIHTTTPKFETTLGGSGNPEPQPREGFVLRQSLGIAQNLPVCAAATAAFFPDYQNRGCSTPTGNDRPAWSLPSAGGRISVHYLFSAVSTRNLRVV